MDSLPLSWTRDVLRFSLYATASSDISHATEGESGGGEGPGAGRDPRFRKLIEAILFSRRLVPTYNLALLVILVVFTSWHWGEKYALARRRKIRQRDLKIKKEEVPQDAPDDVWSSSSSTIEGTVTPPDAKKSIEPPDEETPLLSIGGSRKRYTRSSLKKSFYLIRSGLQYQPPPIPIINKTLPPNSVSIFVLFYLGLNVFYSIYGVPHELMYIFVFTDRCGMLIVANLPLLYLLAAKNQPIKFLTGHSYESLNIFHRRVGELLVLAALLHFLGIILVWYMLLRRMGQTLMHLLFERIILTGLTAFMSYVVLYFTSLGSFRKRCYEVFLATHVFLQLAALVLVFFHHHGARPYIIISAIIFTADRIVHRLWLKSSSHPANLTVLEDDETIVLSSNWDVATSPNKPHNILTGTSMAHGWKPNDHVFLTVPSISKKYIFQSHPFTIFSAAPTSDPSSPSSKPHAWFNLLIRAQGSSGFTRTLLDYARSHPTTRIRLDGPYGSSHALDVLEDSDTAVVVAGGSGIAVAYPLLWALLHPTLDDIETARGSRTGRKVRLLWVVHSASHASWVPAEKMKELREWGLEVLVTPPTSEAGRPDVRGIVEEWAAREGRTGVVVSGPDGMVRDVRNSCAGLMASGVDVSVQVEKFGW
ncbi:hypothetical protein BU24DRAFT_422591 [Aaosphaeria arxii CBS 175.79]|uniref:FAD-binding FR-type domain-containing protein n=1 Tax=Aaosphaeria arxii CBS 175.79 TaxID=1450172 RepID=A0A6A5XVG9_9PLEO|nr:uncharacterized protein BU24DRAFT_422591 [Aaosphaeria arxii CBS 175.79]KAF2016254.1 hypothetical protein BU24DRAFT_422591 [Aaosphaeria arxii CBS 175.79]